MRRDGCPEFLRRPALRIAASRVSVATVRPGNPIGSQSLSLSGSGTVLVPSLFGRQQISIISGLWRNRPAGIDVFPEHRRETHAGMATIVGKLARELGVASAQPSERLAGRVESNNASAHANAAMERYAQGDESAFASVYDSVAPRVHAYLLRQSRDRVIADDLLQQTLLQMHRKRGTYAIGLPVLPWAFAIARRLYIDECRRRKTDALWSARDVGEDDRLAWALPDDEVASREAARLVEAELARMPGNQRAAFELLKVDGLSHQEAAQVLGTTVSAVKLRAFRAYAAIRAVLGRPLEPAASVKQRRQA